MGPTALLPLRMKSCYGIRRSRPGLNPRTLGPVACTLPLDHRGRLFFFSFCNKVDISLNRKATATRIPAHITSVDAILFYNDIHWTCLNVNISLNLCRWNSSDLTCVNELLQLSQTGEDSLKNHQLVLLLQRDFILYRFFIKKGGRTPLM
jgi:hypothetical protein